MMKDNETAKMLEVMYIVSKMTAFKKSREEQDPKARELESFCNGECHVIELVLVDAYGYADKDIEKLVSEAYEAAHIGNKVVA